MHSPNRKSALRLLRSTVRTVVGQKEFSAPINVERAEWLFYIQYLKEGMIVFDAGAQIGDLTRLFYRFVGQQGQVHAFEATLKTYNALTTACSVACQSNIILNHLAVADKDGGSCPELVQLNER